VGTPIRFLARCGHRRDGNIGERSRTIFEIGAFSRLPCCLLPEPPGFWLVVLQPPSQSQDNGSRSRISHRLATKAGLPHTLGTRSPRSHRNELARPGIRHFVAPALGRKPWRPRIDQMIDGGPFGAHKPGQWRNFAWADGVSLMTKKTSNANRFAKETRQSRLDCCGRYYDSASPNVASRYLSRLNKKYARRADRWLLSFRQ